MSRQDALLEAEAVALNLAPSDRTNHFTCPTCGGGASREKSFVVWKNEDGLGIGWKCYRDKCNEAGFKAESGWLPANVSESRPAPRTRPWKGEQLRLTREQDTFLLNLIGFTKVHKRTSGVRFAPEANRFIFPIFSPDMERRGVVLRSYTGIKPKALTRMDTEEPSISWYTDGNREKPLIIVEDIPSAVRASLYTNSVALLGTHTAQKYMYEITNHADNVIWILDNDASSTALKHVKEHRLLFKTSRVHIPTKDLKNMSEPELSSLMERLVHKNNNNGATNNDGRSQL